MEARLPSILNTSGEFQQLLSFMVIKGGCSRGTYVCAFIWIFKLCLSIFIPGGKSQMALRMKQILIKLGPFEIVHIKFNYYIQMFLLEIRLGFLNCRFW